ncbi:hypothetical protein [Pseudoprimorskyibacter insulae]|uniref:Uncharacterized protein n=1 Tax=Pseudoprimorskyibacter insulae TaxID=1695997 RepID=A0A2R8ARB1_9RHOB|nr:hypothetical protein [Pseudoprimorskyibacter insulae]SPF78394.1 hypothetical protein PRI8871_00996 [Pseudoprimorskyibacter insulae]
MDILLRILSGPPLWVWPLLALLIALGILSSRDRESAIWPMFLLPFLAFTGLPNLLAMPDQATTWASFGLVYGLGALAGARKQRTTLVWKRAGRVSVKGEWMSIAMMMLIFWTNFSEGILTAVAPDAIAVLPAKALIPALKGMGSGFFLGRVITVLRATDHSAPAKAA